MEIRLQRGRFSIWRRNEECGTLFNCLKIKINLRRSSSDASFKRIFHRKYRIRFHICHIQITLLSARESLDEMKVKKGGIMTPASTKQQHTCAREDCNRLQLTISQKWIPLQNSARNVFVWLWVVSAVCLCRRNLNADFSTFLAKVTRSEPTIKIWMNSDDIGVNGNTWFHILSGQRDHLMPFVHYEKLQILYGRWDGSCLSVYRLRNY